MGLIGPLGPIIGRIDPIYLRASMGLLARRAAAAIIQRRFWNSSYDGLIGTIPPRHAAPRIFGAARRQRRRGKGTPFDGLSPASRRSRPNHFYARRYKMDRGYRRRRGAQKAVHARQCFRTAA